MLRRGAYDRSGTHRGSCSNSYMYEESSSPTFLKIRLFQNRKGKGNGKRNHLLERKKKRGKSWLLSWSKEKKEKGLSQSNKQRSSWLVLESFYGSIYQACTDLACACATGGRVQGGLDEGMVYCLCRGVFLLFYSPACEPFLDLFRNQGQPSTCQRFSTIIKSHSFASTFVCSTTSTFLLVQIQVLPTIFTSRICSQMPLCTLLHSL